MELGVIHADKVEPAAPPRFRIGWGHYYDGILAANEKPRGVDPLRGGNAQGGSADGLLFREQPSFPGIQPNTEHFDATKDILVYLDGGSGTSPRPRMTHCAEWPCSDPTRPAAP